MPHHLNVPNYGQTYDYDRSETWENRQKKRKWAFVFGNDTYKNVSRLSCCRNDAESVGKAFNEKLHFKTYIRTDRTSQEIKDTILHHVSEIHEDDLVAFFFAGHGYQENDTNYIVGTDGISVAVKWIIDKIMARKPYALLIICDCCRNYNKKSFSSMQHKLPPNVIMVLSCQPNTSAMENRGERNGFFTGSLLGYLTRTMHINDIIRFTIKDLEKKHGIQQIAMTYNTYKHTQELYLHTQSGNNTGHRIRRKEERAEYHHINHRGLEYSGSSSDLMYDFIEEETPMEFYGFQDLQIM